MCLTNSVAQDITANALLALGVKPAMVASSREASDLTKVADAVLINLGTVSSQQAKVMAAALPTASNCAWVLDPVAVQLLTYRRKVMEKLFSIQYPTVIRGNHDEIDFLKANYHEETLRIPMLSTGAVDRIYLGGEITNTIEGGVEMLTKVTATGCSQGAILAGLLAMGKGTTEAMHEASVLMKRCGERAYEKAKSSGSFRTALIDSIYEYAEEKGWHAAV